MTILYTISYRHTLHITHVRYDYFSRKKVRKGKKGYVSYVGVYYKIILSTCQVNSIALSYAFKWDEFMDSYLSTQGQATSLGNSFFH